MSNQSERGRLWKRGMHRWCLIVGFAIALSISRLFALAESDAVTESRPSCPDTLSADDSSRRGDTAPKTKALLTSNLSGWVEEQHNFFKAKHPGVSTWSLKKEVLIGDGSLGNCGFLRYRKKLADFKLQLEYRMSKNCNSGVCIRAAVPYNGNPDETLPSQTGYEVQIMDDAGQPVSKTSSGALYGLLAPRVNASRPAGEWNDLTIRCRGPKIHIVLNGKVIHDLDQGEIAQIRNRPRSGYLSLQNHGHGIEFRNLQLEELP